MINNDELMNTFFTNDDSLGSASLRVAVYGGTFDPITNGHMDIITRSARLVEKLIVAIATNSHKPQPMFTIQERIAFVNASLDQLDHGVRQKVVAKKLDGLLVDFAHHHHATVLVRGLRVVGDFEYEFQMAAVNHQLNSNIETIFLNATDKMHYLASRMVRDVLRHGGDVSSFVPKSVHALIQEKMSGNQ